MIYLDNNATTRIDPEVFEAMVPYLTDNYGNAGSLYSIGQDAKKAINKARTQVADLISARPDQIIFTASGSEANSMALFSIRQKLTELDRKKIAVSSVEHDSLIHAAAALSDKYGFECEQIPVDQSGVVLLDSARIIIDDNTGLVSVMYVNNETGSVNPVYDIAKICKQHGAFFHTDCVQASCNFRLDVNEIGCDLMSISSHKIHGPKGCGALYCSDPSILSPLIFGGSEQEFGVRGGTENVAAIVGFGKACEILRQNLQSINAHTTELKGYFYNTLCSYLDTFGLSNIININGEDISKPGKTLNIRFDGIDAETLLVLLDKRGVCASAGSACCSLQSTPSRVLTAMGVSVEGAHNSVRFSFSKFNDKHEVKNACYKVASCIRRLYEIKSVNNN